MGHVSGARRAQGRGLRCCVLGPFLAASPASHQHLECGKAGSYEVMPAVCAVDHRCLALLVPNWQACESPLAVSVAAGAAALPPLFKLAAVMERNLQGDLRACEQLPVELELGDEFVFHSIFACPVSRWVGASCAGWGEVLKSASKGSRLYAPGSGPC